jgi:WD40 repeat protein
MTRQRTGRARGDEPRPNTHESSTPMQVSSAAWWHIRWLSLCLLMLVAACAPAPSPSSVTPTATGLAQAATITAYHGHTGTVYTLAWSPDGTAVASGSDEQQRETIQVWNATTGHLFISYTVPSSAGEACGTFTLAWSPGGTRIASGGADTVVHLWSAPLCLP